MKYIGIKLVEAEPMTAQRAESVGYSIGSATGTAQGMEITYDDGYQSWCPEHIFVRHNRPLTAMTYGMAIECMRRGMAVARKGWDGKGLFVFKQVPSLVPAGIIRNMTSLPEAVKDILIAADLAPDYANQMAIVNTTTGKIDSWVASSSDTFAEDYYVVDVAEWN